ncbi:MAG: MmgE/PrpD family protein [Pseudomonadota bacterium]
MTETKENKIRATTSFSTISDAIAHFAAARDVVTSEESAVRIARLSVFDWCVVSVAGCQEPVSQMVREMVLAEGGTEDSTVIGQKRKLPPRAAALANGTSSHALDYDDTHFAYLGHPSVAVLPAAFALGEKTGSTGESFLQAALIGLETACRVGMWLGRQHHLKGFHSTSTVGCFGAAMASAYLLQLNVTEAHHALSLAATRASGLKAQFGTMGKPYHAGMAAANGVESALLAKAGFEAKLEALECDQGFADTHSGEFVDASTVLNGLGSRYIFTDVLHKYHACCHATHAALEALIETRDAHNLKPDAIRTIDIEVNPRYLHVCNIEEPNTGLEAKFSYRLLAAMVLARRDTASLETFADEICADPDLLDLRDRVSVYPEPALSDTSACARITLTSGSVLEARHDISDPMTYGEREARVRTKAAAILGEVRADQLWQLVEHANPSSLLEWMQTNLRTP